MLRRGIAVSRATLPWGQAPAELASRPREAAAKESAEAPESTPLLRVAAKWQCRSPFAGGGGTASVSWPSFVRSPSVEPPAVVDPLAMAAADLARRELSSSTVRCSRSLSCLNASTRQRSRIASARCRSASTCTCSNLRQSCATCSMASSERALVGDFSADFCLREAPLTEDSVDTETAAAAAAGAAGDAAPAALPFG